MTNLACKSAGELKSLLARGETDCREIMGSVLDVIERREPQIRAYLSLRPREELLAAAHAVDKRRSSGEKIGSLDGLPVAVKDNLCTKGRPTTCASRMLANYLPPYDATAVRLLEEADGIIIGSPTYFAGVTAETKALIDRSGYVARGNDNMFRRKLGASVSAVRRAGSLHVFDTINAFFLINEMIIPGSIYWNMGIGRNIGEVENDEEGVLTMRALGENMAWLMQRLRT